MGNLLSLSNSIKFLFIQCMGNYFFLNLGQYNIISF